MTEVWFLVCCQGALYMYCYLYAPGTFTTLNQVLFKQNDELRTLLKHLHPSSDRASYEK